MCSSDLSGNEQFSFFYEHKIIIGHGRGAGNGGAVRDMIIQDGPANNIDNHDSEYHEKYRLRLIKEDGTWKVLKAQDKSYYIERMVKPEEEVDKKNHDDMQAKIDNHFIKKNNKKSETEEYLDCLEFNYNKYMKRRVEEEKILDKETKSNNKNFLKSTANVINRPETRAVNFNRANMKAYMNRWGESKNPAYIDAALYGNGDCANYASQIFRAGGAPFDYSGSMSQRWYYTGTNPGGNPGRSYSWAGAASKRNPYLCR